MACQTPYRGDTSQMLLFKIASCLAEGSGGVLSFNGRDGAVTLLVTDVTPLIDDIYVNESGDSMTGSLAMPDGTAALPANTFSGDLDTGMYHPAANTIGLSAGGALVFAVSPTGVNLTTALAYQYNSVNVITAQTALRNYFFGPSGNLTMTGTDNVSVGSGSFVDNTTGMFCTAVGTESLQANTIGEGNSALGYQALVNNIDGNENSAIGNIALFSNVSGDNNVAVGRAALFSNVSGNRNAALGVNSLFLATGSENTAIGHSSLFNLTSGVQNTVIGAETGLGITTGSNNTILGANVAGLAAALSNNIILADGAGVIRIQVASTGVVSIPIGLTLGTAAPLSMTSGANQRAGNAVLVAGTVTVANTTVTANTIVLLTRKTAGGTLGTAITYTVSAGTSFTINSDSAIDTSTFSYLLIEVP